MGSNENVYTRAIIVIGYNRLKLQSYSVKAIDKGSTKLISNWTFDEKKKFGIARL